MLSENIQKFRKLNNMSQQDLAERVHVTRQTVSKWERGQSAPDADLIVPIAETFGTSVSDLLDAQTEDRISTGSTVCAMSLDTAPIPQMIDTPLGEVANETITPKKKRNAWEIVLLVLGSPLWLPLLLVALSLILSLYIVLWAVIIVLWAVFASFVACASAGIATGVYFATGGNVLSGLAWFGAGVFCAGLSVFAFFGCKASTKGILTLTKKWQFKLKKCCQKRRNHHA